jgi:hypothetical protein
VVGSLPRSPNDLWFVVTDDYGSGNGGFWTRAAPRCRRLFDAVNAVLRRWLPDSGAAANPPLLEFLAGRAADEAARGGQMALDAALGMSAAQRDLTALLDGPLGEAPAVAATGQIGGTTQQRSGTLGIGYPITGFQVHESPGALIRHTPRPLASQPVKGASPARLRETPAGSLIRAAGA